MSSSQSPPQQGHKRRDILALDFDGVVCASSGESSYTSILAAGDFWPREVGAIDPSSHRGQQIKAAVHALRPIVETGYENMLLVRLLNSELEKGRALDTHALMKAWTPAMRDSLLEEYGSDKSTLVKAFGDSRDALISKDLDFWVRLNEVYPWASAAMAATTAQCLDYTIVTTKQARFVEAILKQNGVSPPPAERLFDLENPFGAKSNVLNAMLRGLPATSQTQTTQQMQTLPLLDPSQRPFIHFVEDRVETLLAILESPELAANTQLYLVEYGYNTPEQRKLAQKNKDIILLGPNDFQQLVSQFVR